MIYFAVAMLVVAIALAVSQCRTGSSADSDKRRAAANVIVTA
jgi:hypothetical protein